MRTTALSSDSWHPLRLTTSTLLAGQLKPLCEHCNERISSTFVVGVFCSTNRHNRFIYQHVVDLHTQCVGPWKLYAVKLALMS